MLRVPARPRASVRRHLAQTPENQPKAPLSAAGPWPAEAAEPVLAAKAGRRAVSRCGDTSRGPR